MKIGLVPTMGALHAGHASLLRRARQECDVVLSSIFVNPKQFAASEDLSTYPRRFDDDLSMMVDEGVDAVFAPTAEELYPRGDTFSVEPPGLFSRSAEALSRPSHFGGVATVCTKLFNLCRPDVAYFGQKDAFQCVVLRRLVEDLNFTSLEIRVVETARDDDGLALSSRNAYLSPEERRVAPIVYRALSAARERWLLADDGGSPCTKRDLVEAAETVLKAEPMVRNIEYVSVASFEDMTEFSPEDDVSRSSSRRSGDDGYKGRISSSYAAAPDDDDNTTSSTPGAVKEDATPVAVAIVSTAVKVGSVRLIDNILLSSSNDSQL